MAANVKVGDTIRIIKMDDCGYDSAVHAYAGKTGVVEHIDGIGDLHGTWGSLAVVPGADEFEVIQEA